MNSLRISWRNSTKIKLKPGHELGFCIIN
jgi:hypothetical protein